MNKQDAMVQLAALRAEVDRLEAIINAPEVTSLLPAEPGSYRIDSIAGAFGAVPLPIANVAAGQNHFPDLLTARAYADALSTMLELRRQPGSESPKTEPQWEIEFILCFGGVRVRNSQAAACFKFLRTSPYFATREQAEAAIEAVGADRILAMFKTFHGVK